MKNNFNLVDWWDRLEPQWQLAFRTTVLGHSNEPEQGELDRLVNMHTLRLAGPAAPFPNLRFELTNLSGIQHLTGLTIVVITHHNIGDLDLLRNLVHLKSLYLYNNSITSLRGIEELSQLEQLYVQCNQITSIKPVENLVNLKEFYINDNCIETLDGLTENHSDKLQTFFCRPNKKLKQKEIIRVQNEFGIICKGS